MARLKTVVGKPTSSDEPIVSGELSLLEDELQAHRDATSARLDSMEASLQAKLQDSLTSSLATFQSRFLAELKQMGAFATKEPLIQPPPLPGGPAIV